MVRLAFVAASALFLAAPVATEAQAPEPPDSSGARSTSPLLEDLAVRFGARGEFGGDWSLFRPCDASLQVSCEPGLIPQLQPQVEFSLQAEGSIADRLVVDVDFDQTREFAGANRFRLYYQGQEGEALQRVEVGDVSFALPDTRFLTRGIPVGNFGVLARARVGSAEVQGVFAQQQGERRTREFRLGGLGTGAGVIYRDTLVVDDADYVQGQFFYLVDPELLVGAPHVDALALRPEDAPPSVAPGGAPLQIYRMERDPVRRQQVEGFILADATVTRHGETASESGWFRYLRPDEDYVIHSSGLWVTLRTPLRPDEALAVAYIAQSGTRIGDYNPETVYNQGSSPTLRLIRATQAQHQPGRPTWDFEMKQVYRISGSSEVDPFTVDLSVSLGEESGGRTFRSVPGGDPISFLRLFGLDEQSPAERVDRTAVFQPDDGLIDDTAIPGTFLVFPTARPFLDPPPVPSEGLGADEVRALLGQDVNERIYAAPDPFERSTGALYRLNISAEIRSSGVGSVFSLGSFGMREGSERIYLGEILLQPFIDYIIDPQAGIVTLLQPEDLLARGASDVLRVSWEEPGLFQVAPTSVFGVSAHLPFADVGGVDLIGLYQVQRELVSRPRFGAEPSALGMLGARTTAEVALPSFDRVLESLVGDEASSGSHLSVEGELAFVLPDPNRSGDAFLDDFDAGDERTVSLVSNSWVLGSAPEQAQGAIDVLPPVLNAGNAASTAWQHTWIARSVDGDSLGIFDGFLPQEIDRQINVTGTQTREPGLRVTFGQPDTAIDGETAWRSVTTLLSSTGVDLTYSEFLDFYVADGDSVTLVIDLGVTSEDAFFVDKASRTAGLHPETGRPWGLGTLDQEADPLLGEIWNPAADVRGVWVESCLADPGRIYDLGSPNANCTRGNGRRDTEDLNGNQVLDTTDRTVRYVVELDGSSPYLARNRQATGTPFRLYRIPLRGPLASTPSGLFTEADWRAVQSLRVTLVGPRGTHLTLARMRLVGSRWVKRGVEGTLTGIGGDTLSLGGELEVTPVSVLTEGDDYQAPPGVLEELDDPNAAVSGRGVEFNEKSLGLRFRTVPAGDRVEVYNRFLQRPRNFLAYGDMRVWVVARSGSWSGVESAEFFVKVGTDEENFYLYRSPLAAPGGTGAVTPADWLPERIIDFDEWLRLRERAERELDTIDRPPGAPPVTVFSADSTYAVVLSDRARAPNLAEVREISVGVLNSTDFPMDGEVWINELRLGSGITSPGAAQFVSVELAGGEFFEARLDYGNQGPRFRQLAETPTYRGDDELSISGTVNLGSFAPAVWGWDLPITVAHRRQGQDPLYLEGTDLRADGLAGARTNEFSETRISVAFQPDGATGNRLADLALRGLEARFTLTRSNGASLTTEDRTTGTIGSIGYTWRPSPRTVPLLPGFVEDMARILLPGILFERLQDARLRWNPELLSFHTGITRRSLIVERFEDVFEDQGSQATGMARAPESWLENTARLGLRPVSGLGLSLDLITRRDLLDPTDGVRDPRVRDAVERERSRFLGADIGWETRREIVGRLTFQPQLPSWINANLGVQTRYLGERDPGLVSFTIEPDSVPRLLRSSGGRRDLSGTLTVDPNLFLDALLGGAADRGGFARALTLMTGLLSPLTVSAQDGITARFDREAIDPSAGFQLGVAGSGSFERMDEVRATTLVDRSGLSAGTGLRLPGTVFVTLNYRSTRLRSADRRSLRNSQTDTWPDIRVGFTRLPVPEDWLGPLPTISLSAGLREDTRDFRFGAGVTQRRINIDRTLPIELAFTWASGIVARYRGQLGRGEGSDPTGLTERDRIEHGVSVETQLAPRGRLADRIEAPLRFSVLFEYGRNTECRIVSGRSDCVDFIDQLDRSASLALDGVLSGAEVGVQVSLVDRRSFTDLRSGFTQFRLGIWGRMLLEAGPVERLGRALSPF